MQKMHFKKCFYWQIHTQPLNTFLEHCNLKITCNSQETKKKKGIKESFGLLRPQILSAKKHHQSETTAVSTTSTKKSTSQLKPFLLETMQTNISPPPNLRNKQKTGKVKTKNDVKTIE